MGVSPGSKPEGLFVSNRYSIRRKLGSGSTGTVYLVHDRNLDRLVALKLLKAERLGMEALDQLQREFRAIATLHHAQLARAHDFGYTEVGRIPFYTREYVEGFPLSPGPPAAQGLAPPAEFLKPFFDLLDALHYLHSQDVLHLDIHAGNLIVSKDAKRGSVLIDFGLTGHLQAHGSAALLELGSDRPPELFEDAKPGPEADLYSVGRLLLFRLTGNPEGEARLPREIPGWGPRLTLDLERIAAKALQREPRQRFRSAAEFRDALSSALGEDRALSFPPEPGGMTVGRDKELEAIEEVLRQAASGHASLVAFAGPRGIGKSRLLEEARLRSQMRGIQIVEARFHHDPAAEPALLNAFCSVPGERRRPPSWLVALAPKHGGSSLERARRAAEGYFAEEGPPLAVMLDDLELADRESRLLAEALLDECRRRRGQGPPGRGLALIAAISKGLKSELSLAHYRPLVHALKPLKTKDSVALLLGLLRPVKVAGTLVRRLARESSGYPLRLRQIAKGLRAQWDEAGVAPRQIDGPVAVPAGPAAALPLRARMEPSLLKVLRALAILERPAHRREVAAATALPVERVERALRRLEADEIISSFHRGRACHYQLSHPDLRDGVLKSASKAESRKVHERMISFLEDGSKQDVGSLESLALHLLLAERQAEGRQAALKAAPILRQRGLIERAIRLLTRAAALETDPTCRLGLIEEISTLYEAAGDHVEAISLLEPLLRGDLGHLSRKDDVRIRRRLGVHYHRAGIADRARDLFSDVHRLADPAKDTHELVFVDSELAELHTLRGEFGKAEEACRRGLALLVHSRDANSDFRGCMEMTLRASLGHLELRRFSLERAAAEFGAASQLARSFGTTSLEALILNNLGIVHNQRNDFRKAKRCFRRAEGLLERSGERRAVIQIACNLASLAAKTGDATGARDRLEQAAHLLAHYPGTRLEFLVGLSRGLVAYFLGDVQTAIQAFQAMVPAGRKLGDSQFVTYAKIYLAEAEIACGHYGEALRGLHLTEKEGGVDLALIFKRMVHSRLYALEHILGREGSGEASWAHLDATPRTNLVLLEAWNDLWLALGKLLSGEECPAPLEDFARLFDRLGVPAGSRFARVGILYEATARGNASSTWAALKSVEAARDPFHKLLSVMEPLACAEAFYHLGEMESAEERLRGASSAIVGLPFLEFDWRIEFLRARLAEHQGDREGARRYLHRSLHTRDLLSRSLPARLREGLLSHRRFTALKELAARLERPRPAMRKIDSAVLAGIYEGMVGRSPPMVRIFETIERIRDEEITVHITGETGTGKELIARALHRTGPRSRGPFMALHCGSLPSELFESELFGYEKGAFTGADESRAGILEHLAGGTLLLDEITGLSPATQTKLLRVLDARVIRPLGNLDSRPIDVRFLTSSSKPLEEAVASGSFRPDLLFRLRGVEIQLPPLRARREDIPLLVHHFISIHARRLGSTAPVVTSPAHLFLKEFDWPGNVRELEAFLLRALLTCSPGASLRVEALHRLMPNPCRSALFTKDLVQGRDLESMKRELERVYLMHVFEETGGNLDKMMAQLRVKRSSLYRWFKRVGINPQELRGGM